MNSSSLLTRIAKNSIVGFLEKLIEISAGVVSVAVLARYLDLEKFGLYTLITTFAGILLMLCSAGLDRVMVRDIAANKGKLLEYLRDVKGARLILAGISLSLIIIMSFPLGLTNRLAVGSLFMFAFSELISMYVSVYLSVFRAFEKMEYNTFVTFLTKTVTLLGIVAVAYYKLGFFAVFASMAVGNMVKALLTILIFRSNYSSAHVPVGFARSKGIVRDSLIIAASTFFAIASIRMGVFMLKAFGTLKDVAYFQASNVLLIQLQSVSAVIVTALYPVFSSLKHDSRLIMEHAAKVLFMLSLPLMTLTFFFGNDIIMLVYGHKYAAAIPAMRILILSVVFTFLAHLFEIGLLSQHRQRLLTTGWGIAFFVNLCFGIIAVPRYGLIGCAAVMTLSYAALFAALFFFMSKYTVFKINRSIFVKPGAAFIAMGTYLYYFSGAGEGPHIGRDIINISVSLLLYVAVLILAKAFSDKEWEFIRNALHLKKLYQP
ncbi:MAG: oligosaccharide flippase family protein [Nitrospirae bacterium]|nr:oligosaccharide flippase family protein [Nitrospirota bacterium]